MIRRTVLLTFSVAAVFALGSCRERPADESAGEHTSEPSSQATPAEPAASVPPDADAISANNRGVGLMGRFDYTGARDIFAELTTSHPGWTDARVNLAIATLNRQQEGDEARAQELLTSVVAETPDSARARYCLAILDLTAGRAAEARVGFARVVEDDPRDAYASYFLGRAYAELGEPEPALAAYTRALELDSLLRSAHYGAFSALQELDRPDEAARHLEAFNRLASNPQSRLAEIKYTQMGPKCEASAGDREAASPRPRPAGPAFADPNRITDGSARSVSSPRVGLTVVDLDNDGRSDVFVSGVAHDARPWNLLFKQRDDGAFEAAGWHPLTLIDGVNAPLWGDFDEDGLTDVYFCRSGPNQLWRQVSPDQWENVTLEAQADGGSLDTVDGALFDADHDGDLDIFLVNADGPNELLSNNLDGTFRPLAQTSGLTGDSEASRQVMIADLDQDRDADIVVINEEPPHEVYLNDLGWNYSRASGFEELTGSTIDAAVAGDIDADGTTEIFTVDASSDLKLWTASDEGRWQTRRLGNTGELGEEQTAVLALADVTGSGVPAILYNHGGAWVASGADGAQLERLHVTTPAGDTALAAWTTVALDHERGPAVVAIDRSGELWLWPPGAGRHRFTAIALSGQEDAAEAMRSNASGIGARLAARSESSWSVATTFRETSTPGQSLAPVIVGLAGADRADFVAIDWSDGVYQTEIDLEAGQLHRIAEEQRQLSSCPLLLAWNGQRYGLVTDIMGVGGLGYALGRDVYAEPRSWEKILFPTGALRAQDGRYRVKILQAMEEISYIDSVRLIVYDLPPGWRMALDERARVAGPEPTGEPIFFRHERVAASAVNDRGEDVTDTVREVDLSGAPIGSLDERFIGRLEADHVLTVTLSQSSGDGGESGQGATKQPVLLADGWIEYPYSQTRFAAWQAGADYRSPTLDVKREDGHWMRLPHSIGYPAGMPKRMALALTGIEQDISALRLRTNEEIYWDRVSIAYAEPAPAELRRHVPALVVAEVRRTGFPATEKGPQKQPSYDYDTRAPFWDTRHLAGAYTEFGKAKRLVRATDDVLAIIGPGEEIHFEFEAVSDEPPAGWTRHIVIDAHGWAKDMDLYTKDGGTVDPLPTAGVASGDRDRLHARFNKRYAGGR